MLKNHVEEGIQNEGRSVFKANTPCTSVITMSKKDIFPPSTSPFSHV